MDMEPDSSVRQSSQDGIAGFSQRVLRYFLTFLQTDFKRQQAPRRRIQMKSEAGFRTGVPLRKYVSLYNAMWKFAAAAPGAGLQFKLPPSKYTAPISAILRDLIRQHIGAIPPEAPGRIAREVIEYAKAGSGRALENPERFVDSTLLQFVQATGEKLVQPLLTILDGPFREQAYSAIESIYDVESDLTDAVVTRVQENLPTAINTLIVNGDTAPMQAVFDEFFGIDSIRTRIQDFFDDFATADAFLEMRDLQHALRSSEQQSLYLYLCEIRFGPHAFPLFYIPATFEFDDERREFVINYDPHLLVNKQAIDWILQERRGEAASLPISPVQDRIIYLDGGRTFVDEMETVMGRLIPALEIAAGIDLRKPTLQQQSSPTLKIANTAYFAIFDKSDEALLNDYEELLLAFEQEQAGACRMFENIIRGFVTEDPVSVRDAVDEEWERLSIPERLVATSPIPVNEEQRKILSAIKNERCNYIAVQGPPGTGKSHTITAIAFDCIVEGKNVLVLSDKTEALDVVQDKLESALQRVRHGDDDFPNPILRLGRSGSTYNRLVSASAREKIKTHYAAAKAHADRIEAEAASVRDGLKRDIARTIDVYSSVKLSDLDALHAMERGIAAVRPGLLQVLQSPAKPAALASLGPLVDRLAAGLPPDAAPRIAQELPEGTLTDVLARLAAWKVVGDLADIQQRRRELEIFSTLEAEHHPVLMEFIAEYEALRMPVFGFVFRGGRAQALNMRLGAALPCPSPADLHKRLADLKLVLGVLGRIRDELGKFNLQAQTGFAYRLFRDGLAIRGDIADLAEVVAGFYLGILGGKEGHGLAYGKGGFAGPEDLVQFLFKAVRYACAWQQISASLQGLPATDYVGTKSRLEQLNTARMTREIDRRFIQFVQEKAATAKDIGGIIKAKAKFPEERFGHLSEAFPAIIAGIRDYAEYVPLKQRIFDVVVIDEGSQVSVAQALPALLRAKKVVIFGDAKQFSNVKSSQASNAINAGHLTDLEAYFRANVADAAARLQRLKHFDVKKSILEFFDLIANFNIMLRKHFRGYQELISFSSKTFYDNQLQAIKIRSLPIEDVIRFEIVEQGAADAGGRNTNRAEAEYIRQVLRRMVDEGEDLTVGIITPFREQVKLLNEMLYRDEFGERFDSDLRLKVMTFDTCQGEERDIIIYSMVATDAHDALNYVFPVTLEGVGDRIEDALKVQRLNVGFSRAKEGILFVLSKPVGNFRGAIGRVLAHYKNVLETRDLPTGKDTDPSSPMEAKVADWIGKTAFYQEHADQIEVSAQFPIGRYLQQLDPFYSHPAYRCDFLLRLYDRGDVLNIIIEYDGFAEHFTQHAKIHNGNWDHYYRPEDIERQMIIESYGYRFLRLNRFNLGTDPVSTLSDRLYTLGKDAREKEDNSAAVARLIDDASSLEEGTKKRCPKCGDIRNIEDFWDTKLKSGNGGYGKNCMTCKAAAETRGGQGLGSRRRSYYGRSRW